MMACLSSLPRVLLQICTCIEIFLPILFILALMGLRLATLALDSKELCVRPMPNVRAHNMTFHWYCSMRTITGRARTFCALCTSSTGPFTKLSFMPCPSDTQDVDNKITYYYDCEWESFSTRLSASNSTGTYFESRAEQHCRNGGNSGSGWRIGYTPHGAGYDTVMQRMSEIFRTDQQVPNVTIVRTAHHTPSPAHGHSHQFRGWNGS